MDRGNKRQEIIEVALDLFSINGYEATSISQIAEAVGVKKASIYFHFESKQDIMDSIIECITKEYDEHSILVNCKWDNPEFVGTVFGDLSAEAIAESIKKQILFNLHNPHVSKARKLLVIEQYRNEKLALVQGQHNYDDVLAFSEGLIKMLISRSILRECDPFIMAAQLSAPITVWQQTCDREPDREQEVLGLIDRHVKLFFETYKK